MERLTEAQQKTMYDAVLCCQAEPSVAMDTLLKLLSGLPVESYDVLYSESVKRDFDEEISWILRSTSDGVRPRIEAIKYARFVKGWGLKEAKDYVDILWRKEKDSHKCASVTAYNRDVQLTTDGLKTYEAFSGIMVVLGDTFVALDTNVSKETLVALKSKYISSVKDYGVKWWVNTSSIIEIQ